MPCQLLTSTRCWHGTGVGEVWGIGRRIAQQLTAEGITNVLQLVQIDPGTVRRRWSVVLERTVHELQGQTCVSLEDQPQPKKEIAFARSFGQPVTGMADLIEAVSAFVSGTACKLRKQSSLAGQLLVFIHTSPFRPGLKYNRSITVPLRRPTADTNLLVAAEVASVKVIYKPGYDYIKAGVMLLELQPATVHQGELALEADEVHDRSKLMGTLDKLNDRYGRGTLRVAS